MGFVIHGFDLPDGEVFQPAPVIRIDGSVMRLSALNDPDDDGHTEFDATGLLALPGIVDFHGDAFERQIQPRPDVAFDHAIALAETDRQLAANGITTACHGVTFSWEGGLRGREAAMALMLQLQGKRHFAVDHRVHLRFECHHVDGLIDALRWIAEGRVDFLAFNDHLPSIAAKAMRPEKLAFYAERARCEPAVFLARLYAAQSRSERVDGVTRALAAACRMRGIPMASHDDSTASRRNAYRAIGATVCEFPRTPDALAAAEDGGDTVVLGAPNILLGRSHCGALSAIDVVKDGGCRILASDYYYPAMLQAPFRLASLGICSLADAWAMVSAHPAQSLGFRDRGRIANGGRADLLLVEPQADGGARLVATIAAGRLAYCAEPQRFAGRCDNGYRMAA